MNFFIKDSQKSYLQVKIILLRKKVYHVGSKQSKQRILVFDTSMVVFYHISGCVKKIVFAKKNNFLVRKIFLTTKY